MAKSFEEYFNNINIKNIIRTVCQKYPYIDEDDKSSISMTTLWKCIEKYDSSKGTKFTSYLYQQLSYAFKNELKKKKREFACESIELVNANIPSSSFFKDPNCANANNTGAFSFYGNEIIKNKSDCKDIMLSLPENIKNLIHQRFYEKMTMKEIAEANGYSRETARRRLNDAIKTCKKICKT